MVAASIERYSITIEGETACVGTASELAVALDVLQGQFDREALAQLQPHLAQVVTTAGGFMAVMKVLSPADQLFLIRAIGPHLADALQDAEHLRDQLAVMAEMEVEEALLKTLGAAGLHRLVQTAAELAEVLEWVYGECDALALELYGIDNLRKLCRNASDLSAILRSLDHILQARLLEQLGWSFVGSLVRDGRDLAFLLRALPPESSTRLLQHFSARQLSDLIGNARDWVYLYQRLEPVEAEFLKGLLQEGQ